MKQVPRLVKVVQDDSPYFKIISPDDVSHKVKQYLSPVNQRCLKNFLIRVNQMSINSLCLKIQTCWSKG